MTSNAHRGGLRPGGIPELVLHDWDGRRLGPRQRRELKRDERFDYLLTLTHRQKEEGEWLDSMEANKHAGR